jgi:hypothetical protein
MYPHCGHSRRGAHVGYTATHVALHIAHVIVAATHKSANLLVLSSQAHAPAPLQLLAPDP